MEKGYQYAFEQAWEAYRSGTIPIGAAILDPDGKLMSVGRNQCHSDGDGLISMHQIAHAEINSVLKLSEMRDAEIRKNIRTFTLYTTLEPCPLCFGAIVMGSIRNVKFAARDNFAGAAVLNERMDYIKNKKISFVGPVDVAENVQVAMQTCWELTRDAEGGFFKSVMPSWLQVCEDAVRLGERLYQEQTLQSMLDCKFEDVYNLIAKM